MDQNIKTIYYVEDDDSIRELVLYALKTAGFQAAGFEDAKSFYKGIHNITPDMILLDLMLPDQDGISVLKKLKMDTAYRDIPVILLTARSAEYDKVLGLDEGADDYITKPFGVMELISRVNALFRRSLAGTENDALEYGGIRLNYRKHLVFTNENEVELTYKEFDLLGYLLRNQGIVLTREKILEIVWNLDYEGESRTVDVHIGSLRQKLGTCGQLIQTIRGVGYKIG